MVSYAQLEQIRKRVNNVLILVVVDNGLVLDAGATWVPCLMSLNPCCSGQWSRTYDNQIKAIEPCES